MQLERRRGRRDRPQATGRQLVSADAFPSLTIGSPDRSFPLPALRTSFCSTSCATRYVSANITPSPKKHHV